jgi:hypothetical protein
MHNLYSSQGNYFNLKILSSNFKILLKIPEIPKLANQKLNLILPNSETEVLLTLIVIEHHSYFGGIHILSRHYQSIELPRQVIFILHDSTVD